MQLNSIFSFLGKSAISQGDEAPQASNADARSGGFASLLSATLSVLTHREGSADADASRQDAAHTSPDGQNAAEAESRATGVLSAAATDSSTDAVASEASEEDAAESEGNAPSQVAVDLGAAKADAAADADASKVAAALNAGTADVTADAAANPSSQAAENASTHNPAQVASHVTETLATSASEAGTSQNQPPSFSDPASARTQADPDVQVLNGPRVASPTEAGSGRLAAGAASPAGQATDAPRRTAEAPLESSGARITATSPDSVQADATRTSERAAANPHHSVTTDNQTAARDASEPVPSGRSARRAAEIARASVHESDAPSTRATSQRAAAAPAAASSRTDPAAATSHTEPQEGFPLHGARSGTASSSTPVSNSPVSNASVSNTPSANTRSSKTPSASPPPANTPSAKTPSAKTPSANTPSASPPPANTPSASPPPANTPSASPPVSNAPSPDAAPGETTATSSRLQPEVRSTTAAPVADGERTASAPTDSGSETDRPAAVRGAPPTGDPAAETKPDSAAPASGPRTASAPQAPSTPDPVNSYAKTNTQNSESVDDASASAKQADADPAQPGTDDAEAVPTSDRDAEPKRSDDERRSAMREARLGGLPSSSAGGSGAFSGSGDGRSDGSGQTPVAAAAQDVESADFDVPVEELPVDVVDDPDAELAPGETHFTPERTVAGPASQPTHVEAAQRLARPRAAGAAAWLRSILSQSVKSVSLADEWKMIEVQLDDGQGTMTVKARRDEDKVTVSVAFSDPQVRSLAEANADRLQEMLRSEYEAQVDFSLLSDGTADSSARKGGERAEPGAPNGRIGAGEGDEDSSTGRRRAARAAASGARNEWVG